MLLAYLAFLGISLPDGLLGVAWPSMRIDLRQPIGALGLMLPFAVAASMLSSASTGVLLARVGLGRLLAASLALTGAALVTQSLASAFWMMVLASVAVAAGNGAIDTGLNAYAARHFDARRITWMHAVYGFGAAAGPLLFVAVAGAGLTWRTAFALVAAVQGLLALTFALSARAFGPPAPIGSSRPGLRVPASVWPGAVVFLLQNGVESATALWAFVFLTDGRGVSFRVAAVTVSGYWVALLIGRLVLGPVAGRVGARPVLMAGLAGMVGGAVLLLAPGMVPIAGIVLLGASAAPMYPLLMLTTKDRVGDDLADRAVGLQGAAAALGSATLPAVLGLLIAPVGAGVIAVGVLMLTLATSAAYAVATRRR